MGGGRGEEWLVWGCEQIAACQTLNVDFFILKYQVKSTLQFKYIDFIFKIWIQELWIKYPNTVLFKAFENKC